jgi:hypothetical protein
MSGFASCVRVGQSGKERNVFHDEFLHNDSFEEDGIGTA